MDFQLSEQNMMMNVFGKFKMQIRYADDFVVCFQYWDDAIRFYNALPGRFAKFGLELAEEKTRIIQFGRFSMSRQ